MRVLWFTNTPSNYSNSNQYKGGGWISSLESLITLSQDIELGICFLMNGQPEEKKVGGTTYFPIRDPYKGSRIQRYKNLFSDLNVIDQTIISDCMRVVEKFQPDFIHIFGTEGVFGLLTEQVGIPVLIHLQGLLNPIFNAYLPPFVSWKDYLFSDKRPNKIKMRYEERRQWKHSCKRELTILSHALHLCGRTEWDQKITSLLSPKSQYHHVGEILREEFYQPGERTTPSFPTIVSTLSDHPIKGTDTILKTARLLKENGFENFKWIVYGSSHPYFAIKSTGIDPQDVNVSFMGTADAQTLRQSLLSATVFVHPSYIDNSPNSVCEAQILGCPVIVTDVGGKASLVKHGENGFLVPSNDPYQTAYYIKKLHEDATLNTRMGSNARETALFRHDKKRVLSQLKTVYRLLADS